MREILFKGKDKYGEWHIGLLTNLGKSWYIRKGVIPTAYEVSPETIGQYTGLTDKNGKKIFEGDIVKRDFTLWHGEKKKTRETQIGVVFYSDTGCGFNLKNACNLRKPWDGDTLEVLGNIHDNPELLKGGENG